MFLRTVGDRIAQRSIHRIRNTSLDPIVVAKPVLFFRREQGTNGGMMGSLAHNVGMPGSGWMISSTQVGEKETDLTVCANPDTALSTRVVCSFFRSSAQTGSTSVKCCSRFTFQAVWFPKHFCRFAVCCCAFGQILIIDDAEMLGNFPGTLDRYAKTLQVWG